MKMRLRERGIAAGLGALSASGLPRVMKPLAQGVGAILMLHHVRPWRDRAFAPNRGLEITPEFLDEAIVATRAAGFEIVPLDEAARRLEAGAGARPFAVLTFDDGYRDNLVHALPVLERRRAPFTLYVVPGFAERRARLWWVELEQAIARLDAVELDGAVLRCASARQKSAAFATIYWRLRGGSEARLLSTIAALCDRAGVDARAFVDELCLDWREIATLAAHPLCTIGAHTMTHPRLALHDEAAAMGEIAESRAVIEAKLGAPALHFAYPVGDATSAGPRDFALARAAGFCTAVTTRKGLIFPQHAGHLEALPRLSVNGAYQSRAFLDVLLSGAPFLLANRGRRLDVA